MPRVRAPLLGGRHQAQEEREGQAAQGADRGAAGRGEAAQPKVRGRRGGGGGRRLDGRGRRRGPRSAAARRAAVAHALTPAPPLPRHRSHAAAAAARPEWTETTTLTANYQANRFVLDPNEGFGRNQKPLPLKSREEREAEDGGTYSDDDGGQGAGGGGKREKDSSSGCSSRQLPARPAAGDPRCRSRPRPPNPHPRAQRSAPPRG
jgi:hypothetical protein